MTTFTIAPVKLADITCDGYQRDLRESHVLRMYSNFDLAQWNLPKVVAKKSGGYRVVAGQHRVEFARWAAGMNKDHPSKGWPFSEPVGSILCQVIDGLPGVVEEAQLFLNDDRNTRRLSPFDRHRAALKALDPRALAVQAALDNHGITLVHKQNNRNGKTATSVGSLNAVFDMGGADLLDEVLTIVAAWPETDLKRTEGYLTVGLGQVIQPLMASGTYNRKRTLAKMARSINYPTSLWTRAMKAAADRSIAFSSATPYAVVLRDIIR